MAENWDILLNRVKSGKYRDVAIAIYCVEYEPRIVT